MPRFVTVEEAVRAIPDGATVAHNGFTMMGVSEAILAKIERMFLETGHPRDLTVVHSAGQSNRQDGLEHFANEGLVRRIVGSHWGLMPKMSAFLGTDRAEAICLPQGQISNLFRAIAAGQPGNVTKIGLDTFVDPRIQGGKINSAARERAPDYVQLVEFDGAPYLLYRSFPIQIGIIRATTVDEDGNCSEEQEATTLDNLAIAQAAHNSGGMVICQTRNVVPRGALKPKDVAVPACVVDLVAVAEDPERTHRQTDRTEFDPVYISAPPRDGVNLPRADFSSRLVIGRRAIRFLRHGDIVNIGTGIPGDTVGPALAEAGLEHDVTLTVESGVYGGVPMGGVDFGIATHPSAIIAHPDQFNFYDGGGLDATFMGAGEIDCHGNVNVSLLGGRVIGCGGFIDITQSAKSVIFCFAFGGRHRKFVPAVGHLTFSGPRALQNGQEVLFVSDRAVLRLEPDGLHLQELAPGVEPDGLLQEIPFPVVVDQPVGRMPADIFEPHLRPFALQAARHAQEVHSLD